MQMLFYWSIQVGKLSFIILKLQGFGKESVAGNGFILPGSVFLIVCMGCVVFVEFCFAFFCFQDQQKFVQMPSVLYLNLLYLHHFLLWMGQPEMPQP